MNFVGGMKVGTVVNMTINGTPTSKDFGTEKAAQICMDAVMTAQANPTDENINMLYEFLNQNIRVANVGGFEYDIDTGFSYLKGFNTPVPQEILDTVEEYEEKGYPLTSITNFWKLLMANPDKRVREDLYKFIQEHDFSITNEGYMVVYKTVDFLRKVEKDLASFASSSYVKIKDKWKEAPSKYTIYKDWTTETYTEEVTGEGYSEATAEGMSEEEFYDEYCREADWIDGETETVKRTRRVFEYKFTKQETLDKWLLAEKDVEYVGNIQTVMDTLGEIEEENQSVYTDKYTHTMEIKLGVPVKMERTECDADPRASCSYGLHVGATKYVESFRSFGRRNSDENESPVLVCFVNPMNVVAVPEYDHSKMRVTEYYPHSRGFVRDGSIDIVENAYFPSDYKTHEDAELEKLLKANEDEVRSTAINAEEDDRDEEEYTKILESLNNRVIDLAK